jgi:hypothetical protein
VGAGLRPFFVTVLGCGIVGEGEPARGLGCVEGVKHNYRNNLSFFKLIRANNLLRNNRYQEVPPTTYEGIHDILGLNRMRQASEDF